MSIRTAPTDALHRTSRRIRAETALQQHMSDGIGLLPSRQNAAEVFYRSQPRI